MKAIITVVGNKDQKGIVAGVATKVAELGLNIDDISQTVLDEYFTMMAVVSSDEKKRFHTAPFRVGRIRSVSSCENQYQSAAIFDAMHNL